MSYQRERESFLITMARLGMSADIARLILRHATTHQRLAERECNGDDWHGSLGLLPCPDDGKVGTWCKHCDAHVMGRDAALLVHGKVTRSSVRMTQIERRIRELVACAASDLAADFQGDPRGYCVRIVVPATRTQSGHGQPTIVSVPVRNR